MLACAWLAIACAATTSAGAAPILDAHHFDDSGSHVIANGGDWPVGPSNPVSVAFQAIHSGQLASINLRLAARAGAGEKGVPQPVSLELWHADQLLGVDTASEDVPFVWRGDLWNYQFPIHFPRGYSAHEFTFPGVSLTAGGDYEFRATAPAFGSYLLSDSLEPGSKGNVVYSVWVEPDPDPLPMELFSRLTMGADNEVRGAAYVAVEGEPVASALQWDLRQVFSRELEGQRVEYEAKLGSLDFDPPLGPAGKSALGDATDNPGLGVYVGPGQTATYRLYADAGAGLAKMTEATFTGFPLGPLGIPGDVDGNGRVDLSDFAVVKANFGQGAAAAVPEPSGLALVGVGAAVLAFCGVGRAGRRR